MPNLRQQLFILIIIAMLTCSLVLLKEFLGRKWEMRIMQDNGTVFCLTDPVAMFHVREETAPAVLLVVDFGGWYKVDSKAASNGNNTSDMIQHTQVSLLKDVIVPYTHLLPKLLVSENQKRQTVLCFKGAKHRHRGGLVREKIWDLLVNEPGVIMEEGFPNATGKEQSIKGMRNSEFCLHPAGDTPTSCRLLTPYKACAYPSSSVTTSSCHLKEPSTTLTSQLELKWLVTVETAKVNDLYQILL